MDLLRNKKQGCGSRLRVEVPHYVRIGGEDDFEDGVDVVNARMILTSPTLTLNEDSDASLRLTDSTICESEEK